MTMKAYLLTWSPHDNRINVCGPFNNDEAASKSGRRWQKRHNDSPCWQVLSHPAFRIEVGFSSPREGD